MDKSEINGGKNSGVQDNMFSNEKSEGSLLYADFLEPADKEQREIFAQRGFMLVSEFLAKL